MLTKIVPLALLVSTSSFASSEVVDNVSHIGFGYKGANFKSGALKPYFNDKYGNTKNKTMGGLYLDVSVQAFDYVFVEGKADFLTRFSSEVDSWQAGGGLTGRLGGGIASSLSCGAVNYRADSDYSSSYSERGAYCKSMIRKQIANHWLTGVSYQHDFLDLARNEFKWNNVFQFGSVFGLVANLEYAVRDEAEVSYELGLQFSF
ncbi:Outer membrane protein beta-barrel domain-containing protein [Vibrio crassostreae]|nr:Outer membrane protein beta-barrel domain-containing protein [Vibrio crassostreae]